MERILCPICRSQLGWTVLGPRNVRAAMLFKVAHACRQPTLGERLNKYFARLNDTFDAIVGKAEDFIDQIEQRAQAAHQDDIVLLAKQARFALEARRPKNPLEP